jgi:hypothetical protein
MKSVFTSRTYNEIEWQSAYVTVRGSVNARPTWFAHLNQLLILSSQNGFWGGECFEDVKGKF